MRMLACLFAVTCCAILSMACVPRTGFVSLQFCDSHLSHYYVIFPQLRAHGFKGSFACITEASDLGIEHGAWMMQDIYLAGHEIMDHTTQHNYMWATHVDTLDDGTEAWIPYTFADVATWDSLCTRSLFILDSLGITATGWSQPGGSICIGLIPDHPDWLWRGARDDSLYQVIGSKYKYAVGSGVNANTAHLNLRGHNYPDRFPFFNLPHITIDAMDPAGVRTGVADAVASGLWYPAVSHGNRFEQIERAESLILWLDRQDIEVVRCCDGVERIMNGDPDPYANQLPQAAMLLDRDRNDKPDGFSGCCTWDTVSAVPVAGCNAMNVYGDAYFYCYGPEVGRNSLSVWLKKIDGASGTVRIIWTKTGFDGEYLGGYYSTVVPEDEWTLMDSTVCSGFAMDVEDEVDRMKFVIRPVDGVRVRVAYPSFLLTADAGVSPGAAAPVSKSVLRVAPNPVRAGEPAVIFGCCCATVYDITGRKVGVVQCPVSGREVLLHTGTFAPGVYIVHDSSGEYAPAKVVVSR